MMTVGLEEEVAGPGGEESFIGCAHALGCMYYIHSNTQAKVGNRLWHYFGY